MLGLFLITACKSNTGCMGVDADASERPAAADVDPAELWPWSCAETVVAVTGEGELGNVATEGLGEAPMECCYPVLSSGDC